MISVENISKVYQTGSIPVAALNQVSLKIEKGEMIGIIGKSGSGKSTLLNILGGLDTVSGGKYVFDGKTISDFSPRQLADFRCRNVGFVIQNFALINSLTVADNVALPLRYAGLSKSRIAKAVDEILLRLNMLDKIASYPSELSGGQCQRVAIARALIADPSIILADEPTGALDEETGEVIINLFKELNDKGVTMVIVTHDSGIADSCKRIIRLKDGKIA